MYTADPDHGGGTTLKGCRNGHSVATNIYNLLYLR